MKLFFNVNETCWLLFLMWAGQIHGKAGTDHGDAVHLKERITKSCLLHQLMASDALQSAIAITFAALGIAFS